MKYHTVYIWFYSLFLSFRNIFYYIIIYSLKFAFNAVSMQWLTIIYLVNQLFWFV